MLPTIPLNAGAPLDFEAIRLQPVTAHSITLQTPERKRDVGCLDCLEMGTYDSTDLRGCTGWRRGRPRILRPYLVERSVARKGEPNATRTPEPTTWFRTLKYRV